MNSDWNSDQKARIDQFNAYRSLGRWLWSFDNDLRIFYEVTERPMMEPPWGLVGAPLMRWSDEQYWCAEHAKYHLLNTSASLARNFKLLAHRFPPVAAVWGQVTILPELVRVRGLVEHTEEYLFPEGKKQNPKKWAEVHSPLQGFSMTASSTLVTDQDVNFGGTVNLNGVVDEVGLLKRAFDRVPDPEIG